MHALVFSGECLCLCVWICERFGPLVRACSYLRSFCNSARNHAPYRGASRFFFNAHCQLSIDHQSGRSHEERSLHYSDPVREHLRALPSAAIAPESLQVCVLLVDPFPSPCLGCAPSLLGLGWFLLSTIVFDLCAARFTPFLHISSPTNTQPYSVDFLGATGRVHFNRYGNRESALFGVVNIHKFIRLRITPWLNIA